MATEADTRSRSVSVSTKVAPSDKIRLPDGLERKIDEMVVQLRRRQLTGASACAKATFKLMDVVLQAVRWTATAEVLVFIAQLGARLQDGCPSELSIGNTVRRILKIVRTEYLAAKHREAASAGVAVDDASDQASLVNMMGLVNEDYRQPLDIKKSVLATAAEVFAEEIDAIPSIAGQAPEHIHANEVILTIGRSWTVQEFLRAASKKKKRSFEVFVSEQAPSMAGHQMARELAESGISTTLITESAVFAMMARVHKVIIGAHSVMADGSLVAVSGAHLVCQAAKHHSVPVVVLAGVYKLCPLFPSDPTALNDCMSPSPIMTFSSLADMPAAIAVNPRYDHVPSSLVSLFITNFGDHGGHAPSYIYRLLSELYTRDDMALNS